MRNGYQKRVRTLLSPTEHRVLARLNTPHKIQDYVEALPQNFSKRAGETCRSVRRILKDRGAYCFEGAVLAAASLAYHGKPPLLLDLRTNNADEDHVVAVFKENGRWGAISKTNNPVLRWRDPVYINVRELAMSYFHEYFLYTTGEKTLRSYSKPFDLSKYKPEVWLVGEESLAHIADALDASPHFPVAPPNAIKKLRRATTLEREILDLEYWEKKPRKKPPRSSLSQF